MRNDLTVHYRVSVSQLTNRCLAFVVAGVLLAAVQVPALNNGVARTPPMGWNTFNQFGGGWTDATIKAVADSFVKNGMRDVGYIYVNADGSDNSAPNTGAPYWPASSGFGAWAKPLADYVHLKGMKFGVYTSLLTNPTQVAGDLAAAGVDFIKIDAWTTDGSNAQWQAMATALQGSGRTIVFSAHNGGNTLTPATVNMARTGDDIEATWSYFLRNYDANYMYLTQQGPGAWADPDMLESGCAADNGFVLTAAENRSIFSMYCMMASPLLAGFDFSRTSDWKVTAAQYAAAVAIHSNAELIAVDQDPLGKGGTRLRGQNALEVWTKDLSDGSKAVAFFNRTGATATGSISQADLGLTGTIYVRDLWLHQNLPNFTSGNFTASVTSHAAEIYRMSTSRVNAAAELRKMDRSIAWLKANGIDLFPQKLIPGILAGTYRQARAFDVQGRTLSADPRVVGSSLLILRADEAGREAGKFVWPGASK